MDGICGYPRAPTGSALPMSPNARHRVLPDARPDALTLREDHPHIKHFRAGPGVANRTSPGHGARALSSTRTASPMVLAARPGLRSGCPVPVRIGCAP